MANVGKLDGGDGQTMEETDDPQKVEQAMKEKKRHQMFQTDD